uniref:Uncharacterized protein n=1 Tax=Tanacetum cinerariifolium TaxID=118510 RepID=A0A699JQX3_TANCI|nr:hypothetical protein [Tanacetum cinerariifolium]
MVNVLTSLDAATVLSSGVAEVPTGSGSLPTAGHPATRVPTGSDVVPTASPIFTTATESTPYTRRKGKEKMVESDTPKKKKLQEDAEIARIHAEEELQMMIDGLDRNNETVAKYLSQVPDSAKKTSLKEATKRFVYVSIEESCRPTASDKEMELWVELKRLYEPDVEHQLWTHTQSMMHALVEWKLYDTCGVHHVTSKDHEIFMLVEKDCPLQMANDLILNIHKIANNSRQQDD